MIKEADIGVGIIGREGVEAANAADFALREFQHLSRLLFVHGRFAQLRITGLVRPWTVAARRSRACLDPFHAPPRSQVLYSFYKNFVFALIHVIWAGPTRRGPCRHSALSVAVPIRRDSRYKAEWGENIDVYLPHQKGCICHTKKDKLFPVNCFDVPVFVPGYNIKVQRFPGGHMPHRRSG
jgi:hypothetical protein